MSTLLYKQGVEFTDSTGSFMKSAPVEISTVKGYNDFISKYNKSTHDIQTIFNEDKSIGKVLVNDEYVATIIGDAKDYLLRLYN
ncbi:hypothetical protein TPHA_0A03780 [Tetrapisispora phaffii CBS 4417]|uniref:Uncharacterized protein n=1 Tax=Tetrapisispora phaffii (strain ATCC 24235 / CBS 4417 / NBRC 1672 / NRRL Y-8282 / UCD 70-5) TaxID=1071381 RepID=G8BNH6_TETPH|nr:hypothetical protein TPHA_0A03780 [Tetrapisispora phaffii CBS 4417]CCE61454.1 hypothetical protein TPHA_0A03780 [Tetrapisispora phaffii CBS 4417]